MQGSPQTIPQSEGNLAPQTILQSEGNLGTLYQQLPQQPKHNRHQQQLNHSQAQYQVHNVNDRNENVRQSHYRQNCHTQQQTQQQQQQQYFKEQEHCGSQPAYNWQNPSIEKLALTQRGTTFVHKERTMKVPTCNTYVSTSIFIYVAKSIST